MFAKGFARALRAFHGSCHPHPLTRKRSLRGTSSHGSASGSSPFTNRRLCVAAATAGQGALQLAAKHFGVRVGSTLLLGGGAMVAMSQSSEEDDKNLGTNNVAWVQAMAQQDGMEEMLSPGQMLRKHPVAKLVVDQDHLFETMVASNQVHEFRCFYDTVNKQFHSIVQLGKDVCGFPQTVHGGLTAAIVDETLGGLGVCMWKAGALGMRPPAYTARLEVDYKKKIPAGSLILCTAVLEQVDDRKIWMKATVTNGKGVVYASGRALFVAPRLPGENFASSIMGIFKRSSPQAQA